MRVGMWLLEERNSLKANEVASMLNVDRRTLSNWKKAAKTSQKKIGRPRYTESKKLQSLFKVGREWKKQGCPGWRPVQKALENEVPTRLVQEHISRLKLLKRKKKRIKISTQRLSVKVKYKNTYWSQDGAKSKNKKYQIIKDRASQRILLTNKSNFETGKDTVSTLEEVRVKRGLPLVLGTDNGSNYISEVVKNYLKINMVVHLKSLPRTPQHNGAVECAIREIKEAASNNNQSLEQAATTINENRLRASFLFKSSTEIDEKMTDGYAKVDRQVFYNQCQKNIENLCAGVENSRSKRMLERKAILETLEQFELITINRGGLV